MMTGVTDNAAGPISKSKSMRSQPLAIKKRNISSGVASIETKRTVRRPTRSLNDPPSSAPTTPAASRIDREAPATKKAAPSSLKKVGR